MTTMLYKLSKATATAPNVTKDGDSFFDFVIVVDDEKGEESQIDKHIDDGWHKTTTAAKKKPAAKKGKSNER